MNAFTAKRVLCKPHREDDGRDHQKTGGSINATTTTLDDETRLLDVCSACTRVNFARGPKMVVFPYKFRMSSRRGKRSLIKIGCLLIPFFPLSLFRVSFFKRQKKSPSFFYELKKKLAMSFVL